MSQDNTACCSDYNVADPCTDRAEADTPAPLLHRHPLQVAHEKGIDLVCLPDSSHEEAAGCTRAESHHNDPVDTYTVCRIPADPTTPASPEVKPHSFRVSATTRSGLIAGAVQVLAELGAGQVVTTGVHRSPLERRALHIDAGRHYFDRSSLLDLATLAAWCRLNTINLHISETHGYRLASQCHPEVVAPQHISLEDVAALKAHCDDLGIALIPSFDMPGHLDGVLQAHPWARLRDHDGREYAGALDITNPRARELVWELLDEVIDIFDTDEVTIGGDEFLDFGAGVAVLEEAAQEKYGAEAHENDVWIAFLNDTIERLDHRGVRCGVWNDGVRVNRVVDLDPRALLHYWTRWGAHMAPPSECATLKPALLAHSHDAAATPGAGSSSAITQGLARATTVDNPPQRKIYNWDGESLYFVLKYDNVSREDGLPTFESVWEGFDPVIYPDKAGTTRLESTAGAYFSIWCDEPQALSSQQIIDLVPGPLYAFGALCWPLGRRRPARAVHAQLAALAACPHSWPSQMTTAPKKGDPQ